MQTSLPLMDRHEFFRLVGTGVGAILLTNCSAGCSKAAVDDPATDPAQIIDFLIDMDDKANANLLQKGGYTVIKNVIVAQTKAGDFIAVSSKCTHQKVELVYKSTENQFYCPLHLSRFDALGQVLTGPAVQPLIRYSVTTLSNGTLRVFN